MVSQINYVLCSFHQVDLLCWRVIVWACMVDSSSIFNILLLIISANHGEMVWGVYGAYHLTVGLLLCRVWVMHFRYLISFVNVLCCLLRTASVAGLMLWAMLLITVFISVAWLQYSDAMRSSVVNILQCLLMTWWVISLTLEVFMIFVCKGELWHLTAELYAYLSYSSLSVYFTCSSNSFLC